MTNKGGSIDNPSGCPITHYDEVNTSGGPAGWHFGNFDAKREQAPVHTGSPAMASTS